VTSTALAGSFRDPSGFVYRHEGALLRQVNERHAEHYDALLSSGLYEDLTGAGLLIPHEEAPIELAAAAGAHRVLRPEVVGTISYPYEWCFSQLQDAALTTLDIQTRALDHGMSLRDASAFNIQYHRGRPTLIDTLSFEVLTPGRPWVAYRQFCEHFLAPLALMAYRDVRLGRLLRIHLDGVPLDLATRLLPRSARWRPGLGLHLTLHARSQRKHAGSGDPATAQATGGRFTLKSFQGLVESLRAAVRKLSYEPEGVWVDYYDEGGSYSDEGLADKRTIVREMLDDIAPATVWDLGGNTGMFSRLAVDRGAEVVCWDIDPGVVESTYRAIRDGGETRLLPLVLDLANPSPALGWHHRERESVVDRGPVSAVLSLALVHHLAIGNNVPLADVAAFLRDLSADVIVEFVPKDDHRVQQLLASREDVFDRYTVEGFEEAVRTRFEIVDRRPVRGSGRVVYRLAGR
jgi:hypothetical protein